MTIRDLIKRLQAIALESYDDATTEKLNTLVDRLRDEGLLFDGRGW
jgi:hypothetical protein